MTSQSKRASITEALINVVSGMFIAFALSQLAHCYQDEIRQYIWEGFTWTLNVTSNMLMTGAITICSIIRGYLWRRYFNRRQLKRYSLKDKEKTK